jgi:hypothetical protein
MSRQFRVYLLPDDIDWLIAQLRDRFGVRVLQDHSPTTTPVELDSPLRSWPANPRMNAHTSVHCYLAMPSGANIRMWFAGKRGEWLLANESEIIQFSGCDFDGKVLAVGRFYFQTDKLVSDTISPKRPAFLTWADQLFRATKKLLLRSKALDAYVGPSAADWWKNGGELVSQLTENPAFGRDKPDI